MLQMEGQANLLIQQVERGCGILEGTIGCQHPLHAWSLLHGAWLQNRYVVKQGHTANEYCETDATQAVLPCLVNVS